MKYRNTRKAFEFPRSFPMVGRFAPRSTGAQNRYSAVSQKGIEQWKFYPFWDNDPQRHRYLS